MKPKRDAGFHTAFLRSQRGLSLEAVAERASKLLAKSAPAVTVGLLRDVEANKAVPSEKHLNALEEVLGAGRGELYCVFGYCWTANWQQAAVGYMTGNERSIAESIVDFFGGSQELTLPDIFSIAAGHGYDYKECHTILEMMTARNYFERVYSKADGSVVSEEEVVDHLRRHVRGEISEDEWKEYGSAIKISWRPKYESRVAHDGQKRERYVLFADDYSPHDIAWQSISAEFPHVELLCDSVDDKVIEATEEEAGKIAEKLNMDYEQDIRYELLS